MLKQTCVSRYFLVAIVPSVCAGLDSLVSLWQPARKYMHALEENMCMHLVGSIEESSLWGLTASIMSLSFVCLPRRGEAPTAALVTHFLCLVLAFDVCWVLITFRPQR